jgi:hypothetical protein
MSEETDKQYLALILPKLKEKMPYKWRVQSFSKYKPEATCVAYIDARDVMDRLDEVCSYGWHRNHEELKGRIYAGVGIILPSSRVMWRWDCGTESSTEAEKGESSDSFKRAAVNVGVGRFLYDLKITKLPANKKKVQGEYPHVVDNNGKQVWDLTKHIGDGSKTFAKPKPQPLRNWIEEIKTAGNLERLKEIYEEAYNATDGKERVEVTREKDKRKQQLKGDE